MVSVAATKSVLKAVILQGKKHIVDALIAVNNAETQYPQIEKKNLLASTFGSVFIHIHIELTPT